MPSLFEFGAYKVFPNLPSLGTFYKIKSSATVAKENLAQFIYFFNFFYLSLLAFLPARTFLIRP